MVKIPFALNGSGCVGFPQTAHRLLGWKCPSCNAAVIVKRGSILTPHFAHKANTTTCSAGESVVHRATKEWVASIVGSPGFRVTGRCCDCWQDFDAFKGAPDLSGRTEIALGQYRVDAVANRSDGSIAAAFEILHTHATGHAKMSHLMAKTLCNAFEVKAVPDLVAAGYPTVFKSVRPLKCKQCTATAIARRKNNADCARQAKAKALGRKWKALAAAAVKERQRRFAQRWLFLARVSTVFKRAKALHEAEERKRIKPCGTCGGPVEMYTWVKTDGAPWGYAKKLHKFQEHVFSDGKIYHTDCTTPWCSICMEQKSFGKWCACERSKRRKCVDCNNWHPRSEMHSYTNPPENRFPTSWVCDACAINCRMCDNKISQAQSRYGGACFTCNRRAKRRRMGLTGESLYYCRECGARKTPDYSLCYSCAFDD